MKDEHHPDCAANNGGPCGCSQIDWCELTEDGDRKEKARREV